MRLLTRGTALIVALTMLMFAFGAGTATAAPPTADPITTAVTGTTSTGDAFAGTLDVTKFAVQQRALVATGTLTGTVTDAVTGAVTTVATQPVAIPVDLAATQAGSSCEILDLVLGPIHLDLLGLVVDLDVVHLNITAEQGPGNLLGNLLCAIVGLLDGPGPLGGLLNGIAALLNRILGALG
jgi:hypothetical protein